MNTPDLHQDSLWNDALMLPRVTDNRKLLELQILLGGLHLVLSRVHPSFAATRFNATQQLALQLRCGLEAMDPHKAHMSSTDLQRALTETESALDPGSLMVLRKRLAQTLMGERDNRSIGHADFTYSQFLAEGESAARRNLPH